MPAKSEIGYALSSEEHPPLDLVRHARLAEEAGFNVRSDLRPLPPVDQPPGQQPVRVGRPRRDRRCDREDALRDGRHLPDHPDPPGDHRARRRHGGGTHARSILPRGRDGREPQRARPRPRLAGVGRPRRDAGGGRRGHPKALEGRHRRATTASTTRWRTRGCTPCPRTPPEIYVAGERRARRRDGGRIGDGFIGTGPKAELIDAFKRGGGRGPRYGQVTLCWDKTEEGRTEDRARMVADGRDPG